MKLKTLVAAAAIMIGICGSGWAQHVAKTKDDLFAGTEMFEKNAVDITEVNQGPESLDMVKGKDQAHAHQMVLNVVRSYSYDKPGMFNLADVDVFRKKLDTGGWECSVHTRNLKTGNSTDVCDKPRTDGLKESAIISVSPKSLTFVHSIMKRGAGDQSRVGAEGGGISAHGPDMAMLNVHGDGTDAEKQTMQDKDMNVVAPGAPVQMKVVRPEAATVPTVAPSSQP